MKINNNLPAVPQKNGELEAKVKRGFRRYVAVIMCVMLLCCMAVTAFATETTTPTGDPLTVVTNLGWGIVQVGLSLQSHDPSQRSNGFLTLAGGIVITFAKEILNLITG